MLGRPFSMLFALCLLCLGSALTPPVARGEALPFSGTLTLGKPAKALRLEVRGGEKLTLEVGGKRHQLPAPDAQRISVESVRVGRDAAVAILRAETKQGSWFALLGGRAGSALLASGPSDWHGDPGERRMQFVEASEPNEQGERAVHVATRHEGLTLCGNRRAWVKVRRVDPNSLELVEGSPLAAVAQEARTERVADVGPESAAPARGSLVAVGSSRVDEATGLLVAPHAAVDGNPNSAWSLGVDEFAVFRWSAQPLPIQSLAMRFAPAAPAGSGGEGGDETLWIFTDQAPALRVRVPPEALREGRLRVTPDKPLTTRCVALLRTREDAARAAGWAVTEVQAFSDLDGPDGVRNLVSRLVQDDEAGAAAADLLASLDELGAVAVAERFDALSPRGRRRALRVLSRGLARPEVRARVLQTAREGDRELRDQALTVLQAGGEPGRAALREAVQEPGELGDAAAKALAAQPEEASALLRALGADGGSERPGLRSALVQAARHAPEAFEQAAAEWLNTAPAPAPKAALALAAAEAGRAELARQLVDSLLSGELAFPERYRAALALSGASASEQADAWLEQQSVGADEWMMRRAAFEALRARAPERASALAAKVASDAYPRVRAVGIATLAQGKDWQRAFDLARKDTWPLVRVATVQALAPRPEAQAALKASLGDPSWRVRSVAIDALTELRVEDAWPQVAARLADASEAIDVRDAAVSFARSLCLQDAREALVATVRRSLHPEASDDDVRLGVTALRALHDLGGAAAADARNLAQRDSAPPGLARAHAQFGPPRCAQAAEASR